jgi:DNA-binding transcriptional LysR family regulator
MELRDLRYFLAAAEAGSLTSAARTLHVAQPTLSHAIARLESEAREELLQRAANRRHGVRPTAAGARLAQRARRILAEMEGFRSDLADLQGLLAGELTIGSIQSLNPTLLPGPLAGFAQDHPGVHLQLRTLSAEDLPGEVRAGRCDLAIVAGAPPTALGGCSAQVLLREGFVAIVRRDDPLARSRQVPMRRLADRTWLSVLPGTYTRRLLDEACRLAGFTPRVALELESGEALRETVRAGFGLTVLPGGYLRGDDPGLVAVKLTHPTPEREVLALLPNDRPATRPAQAFVAALQRWVSGARGVAGDGHKTTNPR